MRIVKRDRLARGMISFGDGAGGRFLGRAHDLQFRRSSCFRKCIGDLRRIDSVQLEFCTYFSTITKMIGQFFTPDIVAECMFRVAGVHAGQRVIDPSCGDGSFLRIAPRGLELYGCEIDPQYTSVSRRFVSGKRFVQDDALSALVQLWDTCDLVVGNPPFSAQKNLEKRPDVLQGYDLGVGRKSQCFEVLFLELFLKLAKPGGKIAIILPDGPLSNRPFKYVREWLLHRAHVEAIISLPRGIFNRTTAKTNILIAQRQPFSAQCYREPTYLLKCDDVSELKPLRVAEWRRENPCWRRVILAVEEDWRPEAQDGIRRKEPTDSLRLGDIFGLRTGFALYAEKRKFFDTPDDQRLLLIRAKNLAPEGGLRLDQNCAYISQAGEMFREQSVVHPGEILFVRVGAGCYGRTALVPKGTSAQADDWIHVLTPLVKVDGAAVVAWFNSEAGRAEVRRLAKGVGTLSVSKSSLAELRIPARLIKQGVRNWGGRFDWIGKNMSPKFGIFLR
jgi:type I restriction enzyme M protein